MDLYTEILVTIQQIGAIFALKNIPACPVNTDYLGVQIAPNMEKMVLTEMIYFLEDQLAEYLETEKRVHKFAHYLGHFMLVLEDNTDGDTVIGRKRRSA